ncbi:MAG: MiaB/RimO family radical SAM methylthiotransferase [Coriobacteriia bacterium]|nr:MiaB/RimO family radical SAM methylthiotransferase [Coriobacteriia bacterium]
MNVFVKTFGCKVNQAESIDIADDLRQCGCTLVPSATEADVAVVNTCSVTAVSDAKVRKAIRRMFVDGCHTVIATGCMAVVAATELAALDPRVIVEPDKTQIGAVVKATARGSEENVACARAVVTRTRVNVKITDGCENFCTYCIVPYARGPVRHTPSHEIIERVRALRVADCTKEIVLVGINIGAYYDPAGKAPTLAALVRLLHRETGVRHMRLSSMEPPTITDDIIDLFRDAGLLHEHLHIPIQSGSDIVLAAMGRRYTTDDVRRSAERLRVACPNIALHADIIVGYPTETDDDFERTYMLVRELDLAGVHLFRFSARPGTAAAALTPLDPRLLEERFIRLRELTDPSST